MCTSQKRPETITTIGVDLGKNTFHLVGLDKRAAIVLQQKVSVVSWNAALPIFRVA
jgi:transposase